MRCWMLALLLAGISCLGSASAQVIVPADNHVVVSTNVTRGSAAPQFNIWIAATGGRDPGNSAFWGRNYWTCWSSTDPDKGACATDYVWHSNNGLSMIPLRFTEVRSGLSLVLDVHAYNRARWAGGQCAGSVPSQVIENALAYRCNGAALNDEKLIWAYLPPSELVRLPTGGVWKANFHLRLNRYQGGHIANFTAAITVNVTDNQNMQVFLPEFGSATPRVDLNLRHLPSVGGARVSGERALDACIYDGFNANSQRYTVRMTDPSATAGDEVGRFFIRHPSPQGALGRNRIEYEVHSTTRPFGSTQYQSAVDRVFANIPDTERRQVMLPNLPLPVICTPWPLTLRTPEFANADKQAGHYSGVLRMEFSASTTAP